MTLITKQVQVCKEVDEVFEAVKGIVADIRAKKAIPEIVTGNLGKLMTAVQGFDQLSEEVKTPEIYETAGLGVGGITKAILAPVAPVA